jgi:SAM-dependent methyltransferase
MSEINFPLPPLEYRKYVSGGPGDEASFNAVGDWAIGLFRAHSLALEGARFLDIGCGCGRIARRLAPLGLKSYDGFDRHPGMIEWCQQHITPLAPNFQFCHLSVRSSYSDWDGHHGEIDAESLVFPYADAAFDSISLTSVFTHMPLREILAYSKEITRVLASGGRILTTVFHENAAGLNRLNFGFHPDQFRATFADAGLRIIHATPDSYATYILTK